MGCSAPWLEARVEIMTKASQNCVPTSKVDSKSFLQDVCSSPRFHSLPHCLSWKGQQFIVVGKTKGASGNCSYTLVVFYLSKSCTFGCILQLPRNSERKAQYLIPLNNTDIFLKAFFFQTVLLFPCVVSLILSPNW